MTGILANLELVSGNQAAIGLDRRKPAGLPPLPEDQTLIAEAARAAGLGPWVRYGTSADCMYCSAEAAQVFGVDPEHADTAFLEFWSFVHPDHRDRVSRLMETTRRDPHPYAIEYAINLPNGETRYVAETAQPFFDEAGKLTHFLGAFQDITERRHPSGAPDMENFDQSAASGEPESPSDIAAKEEIRALLDIIITSSELMLWQQEGELPETYHGYTRDIRRSGMDLKLILEDMLSGSGTDQNSPSDSPPNGAIETGTL